MSFYILVAIVALVVIFLLVLFAGNKEKSNTLLGVWKDEDTDYIYEFKDDKTFVVDKHPNIVNADYELVERDSYDDKGDHVSYRFINAYYSKDCVISRRFEIKNGVASFYEVASDGDHIIGSTVLKNTMKRIK